MVGWVSQKKAVAISDSLYVVLCPQQIVPELNEKHEGQNFLDSQNIKKSLRDIDHGTMEKL